ncbi:hypothetical protein WJX64_13070 [Leifsonia sp. YIM 134122]|uniref:SnoaL-like domain-containing protein n=1 Tax=Leifsonia stereocauli TaxID=3134136 RepID=A0ABU9W663_9MICO
MSPDRVARLLVALDRHDDLALAAILHPDARLVIDSGTSAGGVISGRARVSRALGDLTVRHPDASFEAASVNGAPGIALRDGGAPGDVLGILAVDASADGSVGALWLCTATAKLEHWNGRSPGGGRD